MRHTYFAAALLVLAGCSPVTNVTIVEGDAGHGHVPSSDAPPTEIVVKVVYEDATPTAKIIIEYEDAHASAGVQANDAAIQCPDVTTCGTILGPTALVCLADIDICYAMRSTQDPIDDTDNRYDACVDICQAELMECQAQFVNPDGTIIGAADGGVPGEVTNQTPAYDACGETYTGCCSACLG